MNLKKKIITSLGIAVMAMAMFFSTNTVNSSNGDFNLASLLEVNTANAECDFYTCYNYCYDGIFCTIYCNGEQLPCFGRSNTP